MSVHSAEIFKLLQTLPVAACSVCTVQITQLGRAGRNQFSETVLEVCELKHCCGFKGNSPGRLQVANCLPDRVHEVLLPVGAVITVTGTSVVNLCGSGGILLLNSMLGSELGECSLSWKPRHQVVSASVAV